VYQINSQYQPHKAEPFLTTQQYGELAKKFPTSYGTVKFITVFTEDRQRSLPWARWIHSTPFNLSSLRSILRHSSRINIRKQNLGPVNVRLCLLRLSVQEVMVPSTGSLRKDSFGYKINRERINGFSWNLVWRVCHWNEVQSRYFNYSRNSFNCSLLFR
jgi:hypothetical protein